MTGGIALPSSSGMERDARRISADQKRVAPGEIALGVIIGRMSEFFDFFVYAIASVLVFPKFIFPEYDKVTATLYSFALFALAFLARPVGSFIFMEIDRRHGRGVKLTIAMFLLGGSTAAIAFLPGYSQVGVWSVALLALCRIAQGLALGGAWDGLASLLALNAPQTRRGWYAMMPQLGAPLGLLLASALFAFFVLNLSSDDFLDWGWRYPFFVAFAVNVVALFARLRLVVTNEFATLLERRELEPTPVGEMLRAEGGNVILGALAPLASFALFHMVSVFPLSWVFLFTREGETGGGHFLILELVGAALSLAATCASGVIADRIGRKTLLAVGAGLIAVFSVFAPLMLGAGGAGEIIYMVVGFILLGLSFGQAAGAVASNFSARYRYTGSALTSDLAWVVGAGFAPLVALVLATRFGLISSGAYLLSGAVCTLLVLTVNRQLQMQNEGSL